MRVVARVWFVISTVMLPRSAKNKPFVFFFLQYIVFILF